MHMQTLFQRYFYVEAIKKGLGEKYKKWGYIGLGKSPQ